MKNMAPTRMMMDRENNNSRGKVKKQIIIMIIIKETTMDLVLIWAFLPQCERGVNLVPCRRCSVQHILGFPISGNRINNNQ